MSCIHRVTLTGRERQQEKSCPFVSPSRTLTISSSSTQLQVRTVEQHGNKSTEGTTCSFSSLIIVVNIPAMTNVLLCHGSEDAVCAHCLANTPSQARVGSPSFAKHLQHNLRYSVPRLSQSKILRRFTNISRMQGRRCVSSRMLITTIVGSLKSFRKPWLATFPRKVARRSGRAVSCLIGGYG